MVELDGFKQTLNAYEEPLKVLGQDRAFAEDYEGTPENAGLCEGGPGSGKFI